MRFVAKQGLSKADMAEPACHPGGGRVVDALAEYFGDDLAATRSVLRQTWQYEFADGLVRAGGFACGRANHQTYVDDSAWPGLRWRNGVAQAMTLFDWPIWAQILFCLCRNPAAGRTCLCQCQYPPLAGRRWPRIWRGALSAVHCPSRRLAGLDRVVRQSRPKSRTCCC